MTTPQSILSMASPLSLTESPRFDLVRMNRARTALRRVVVDFLWRVFGLRNKSRLRWLSTTVQWRGVVGPAELFKEVGNTAFGNAWRFCVHSNVHPVS